MKTLYTTYSNFAKRFVMSLIVLMTVGVGSVLAQETLTATLTFDDLSKRTTFNENQQVWEENGIVFTNDKAKSTTDVRDYYNPIRCYKKSKITIQCELGNIKQIIVNTTEGTSDLQSAIGNEECSSTTNTVTITPADQENDTYVINQLSSGGVRISKITVSYEKKEEFIGQYSATLVTDATDLKVGEQIVIAAKNFSYAINTLQYNNNRAQAEIGKDGNTITFNDNVEVFTLESGTKNNTFSFRTSTNEYLYAASNSENWLRTESTKTDNGSWIITIANDGIATIKAQGTNTHNWLRYNSGAYIFSCYASGQNDVSIYKVNPANYTVTLNPNGGNGDFADWEDNEGLYSKTVEKGIEVALPTLEKEGHNFGGWSDGTNTYSASFTPTSDITLIAQWTPKSLTNYRTLCTYDIILGKNGGTADGSARVTATKTNLTAINAPVYAGYQVLGYYAEPGCSTLVANTDGTLQANIDGYTNANGGWIAKDATLYPKWEAIEYTITWVVGGDKDKPFATTTASATTPLVLPDPAPANDAIGCCADAFIGWSTQTNPTKAEVFNNVANAPAITGNQTFHAVFATAAPGAGTSLLTFSEMGYANATILDQEIALGDGEGNGDATITFAQSEGGTAPAYYNAGASARAYAGNTINIVSTSDASTLSKIVFSFANGDGNNEITASVGTYADGTWTGTAEVVTFTIGGDKGHRRISTIAVSTTVVGDPYTNYVTKCDALADPTLGEATLTYHNDGSAITVKCGQQSSMNTAAKITLDNANNLTCPVTVIASDGFLVSTSQRNDAGYKTSLTISPYKKSSTNYGKLRTIYVRADATGKTEDYSGTITIEKTEGTPETSTIAVNAVVNCQMHKLYITNHLGEKKLYGEYHADAIIDNEPNAPEKDDCSEKYTFVGWSQTSVTYGSLAYAEVNFPFSMPANDVILYPVYQVNADAVYHRVTQTLPNWAGDYLIAHSNTIFADGRTAGTDGLGKQNTQVDLSASISNNIIPAETGDLYNVTLENVEGMTDRYVLKTKDGKYNYQSSNANGLTATQNISTASKYAIDVRCISESDIQLALTGNAAGAVFRYSTEGYFRFYANCTQEPIYLYKKSPLYTTPLICGTIEAADAVVTSTAGQTIKVNVPVTLTSDLTQPNTIEKAVSDNPNFSVTALQNAGQHTIAIGYTPTATTDGTETANITLTASNNATTTFQVTGRHLPENFVIAAKWGDNWYVLPADMNSESITEGLLIEVDNPADPTKAKAAPNTTKYGLKSVYTSNSTADRYAAHGERLVFVENVDETTPVANQTLYNGGGDAQNSTKTNIQVYAKYANYHTGAENQDRYEWIPTTTDLKDYILTSAHTFATEAARTVSLDNHGVFGTLLQDKSYDGKVRLLPVDNFYASVELQVVEWKQNSISIMYTGAGTKYTTKVGNNAESGVQSLSKIDHAVYTLSTSDLTAATNQPLIIAIKDDADATIGTIKLTIPAIVATDKNSTALGVTEANAKATSIVVLDGATLTADATKYIYDDITVYPGGSLVIGDDGKLGMYSLTMRAGSSWGAPEYENKYPQFLLKGEYSNTSAQINLDYVTTVDYYYPLSVPEEVTIADIKYPVEIYGSNVEKANKGSFQLKYYDGAQRVEQGSQYGTGWVVVDESTTTTLAPNQGYAIWGIPKKINGTRQTYGIHRIPIKKAANDLVSNEMKPEEIQVYAYGDASTPPNDRGWNYLGNPYLAQLGGMNGSDTDLQMGLLVKEMVGDKWTGGWVNNGDQVRYITLTNDCQNFQAVPVANATISPFTTFFVQAGSTGAISLTSPTSVTPSPLVARRYAAAEQAVKEITTGIQLIGNGQTDRTGLLIADNFTEEYEFNADLSKFENSGINLYTIGKDGKLAYMAINQTLAEQPIPVGYSATADGEYVIAFDEDRYNASDISALYLIDYDRNETTNLLHYDYTFHTAAGTYNQRFALQVAFLPANATNVEWVGESSVQLAVSGNTLLLNNLPGDATVTIYDAVGHLITTALATTEMQINLPTGYYLVRIANKQQAIVIDTIIP